MIVWCSFIEWNLNYFWILLNFFTITYFTFSSLSNNFTLSRTSVAMLLNLLIHSWTHLIHLNNDTFSFTCFAFLNTLSTFSIARLATSSSAMLYFNYFAVVNILKGNFKSFFCRFYFCHLFFLSSLPSSLSSEKHV